ncbi:hypothetical protein LIER_08455 [Lithospermum erythrorhizon]|uniref:Uncharacterized protein n=1 Tax=Lithospermum erythrorhizon TaxID=34254 RepID=A0AAV3PEU5_LITER
MRVQPIQGWSTNEVFSNQIGRNMEIYVDDMLVKSREAVDSEANLRQSFESPPSGPTRATGACPFFKSIKEARNLGRTMGAVLPRVGRTRRRRCAVAQFS